MSRIRSASFEALGVGVVSGMRTFLMPALLSRALQTVTGSSSGHGAARLLRPRAVSNALVLASSGELIGDKLPIAPDRTGLPSLAARAVSGGFAAMVIASRNSEAAMPAAVLGALGAIGSAHVMMRLRKATGRRLDIPDPLVGLAEDFLALALGHALISTARRDQAAARRREPFR